MHVPTYLCAHRTTLPTMLVYLLYIYQPFFFCKSWTVFTKINNIFHNTFISWETNLDIDRFLFEILSCRPIIKSFCPDLAFLCHLLPSHSPCHFITSSSSPAMSNIIHQLWISSTQTQRWSHSTASVQKMNKICTQLCPISYMLNLMFLYILFISH